MSAPSCSTGPAGGCASGRRRLGASCRRRRPERARAAAARTRRRACAWVGADDELWCVGDGRASTSRRRSPGSASTAPISSPSPATPPRSSVGRRPRSSASTGAAARSSTTSSATVDAGATLEVIGDAPTWSGSTTSPATSCGRSTRGASRRSARTTEAILAARRRGRGRRRRRRPTGATACRCPTIRTRESADRRARRRRHRRPAGGRRRRGHRPGRHHGRRHRCTANDYDPDGEAIARRPRSTARRTRHDDGRVGDAP